MNFAFHSPPKWQFGSGAIAKLGTLASELGARRALVVTSAGMVGRPILAEALRALEGARLSHRVFAEIPPDPPISVVDECRAALGSFAADCVIGLGGGSAMDAAKLAAMLAANGGALNDYFGVDRVPRRGLPTLMVPTTAGTGSEVSPDAVVVDRDAGTKRAVKDHKLIPDAALVDPDAVQTLPARVAAISGVDALTHAIEAFTSRQASPLSDAMAREALARIRIHLYDAVTGEGHKCRAARAELALAASLAGLAFANAGTAAIHACAYPLSGMFGVPHGEANGLMLAPVTAFNLEASSKYAEIAAIFGVALRELPEALRRSVGEVGLPTRLRDVGVSADAIPEMARVVLPDERHLSANPRSVELADLERLFADAL